MGTLGIPLVRSVVGLGVQGIGCSISMFGRQITHSCIDRAKIRHLRQTTSSVGQKERKSVPIPLVKQAKTRKIGKKTNF